MVVAVPAVDEHRCVVIVVQEDELLFAEDDEESVDEFGQLAHDEQVGPVAADAVTIVIWAHWVDDAAVEDGVVELGPSSNGAKDAECGKHEIPEYERRPQFISGTICHQISTNEYEQDIYGGDGERALPVARHPALVLFYVFSRLEAMLKAESERVVVAG